MLTKMGWTGDGIGKQDQGRKDPIPIPTQQHSKVGHGLGFY